MKSVKKVSECTTAEILILLAEEKCDWCPYSGYESKYKDVEPCPRDAVLTQRGELFFPRCADMGTDIVDGEIAHRFRLARADELVTGSGDSVSWIE